MLTPGDCQERSAFIARAASAPRAVIARYRDALLRRLLQHAYERVPYYRDLFDQRGLHPSRLSGVADLTQLPLLTRETLQTEPLERMLASGLDVSRLSATRSSGSTGVPVRVRYVPPERELYHQVWKRTFELSSPRFGGHVAYVALDHRPPERRQRPVSANFSLIECRQPLAQIAQGIVAAQPDTLMGYTGVLAELALHTPAAELALIRPRLVVSMGEVLTPAVRALLAERFAAPVTTQYACTECIAIGGECPAGNGYHLADDSVVAEVVDEHGQPVPPGEHGQVVLTGLHGFSQPLIRYAVGDVAVQGKAPVGAELGCSCGAPFSTLGSISGRQLDYLVLPDGRRLHAYSLSIPLRDDAPFIQRYQIVQERADHVRVRMICAQPPSEAELTLLRERLQSYLAPDVAIEFEVVGSMQREPNGKFRVVVSHVQQRPDQGVS
jgi:phenylacetate-CoA ligase